MKKVIEEYWLDKLSGQLHELSLPWLDNSYGKTRGKKEQLVLQIPGTLSSELKRMTRNSDTALLILFISGLSVMVHKYTGNSDIIIGTCKNEELILCRIPISQDNTLKEIIDKVKISVLEGFNFSDYSYAEIYKKLLIRKGQNELPLYNLALIYDKIQNRIELFNNFNMVFLLSQEKDQFCLNVESSVIPLYSGILHQFCQNYVNLFHDLTVKLNKRLDDLEIISTQEKKQLLNDFNNNKIAYPSSMTIDALFEEQVKTSPHHTALIGKNPKSEIRNPKQEEPFGQINACGEMHVTYRELNKKSGQLTHLLRRKGVGPDIIVGMMAEHSLEMIIGILGILKAGGTYLPLDPDYPKERIKYMLKDSEAKILLKSHSTDQHNTATCMVLDFVHLNFEFVCYSRDFDFRISDLNASNLSYVIYTSGSSGKPKGVMVEHRNVARLVKNPNYIDLTGTDSLLLTGNFVFDITTFEIWSPLLNGLKLYLVDRQIILEGKKLKHALAKNRINILHLVPQVFNQLASVPGGLEIFAGLHYFLVGGDLVSPKYINEMRKKFKELKILHMYGPTENTTFSTFYLVDTEYETRIPIGKPINNSSVFIVDQLDKLQPLGVAGELCVGGDGLARGYLNKPELTFEKFDHDFWDYQDYQDEKNNKKFLRGFQMFHGQFLQKAPPGRRRQKIYKTGDLARWLPDGNIEFLGRIDHQVKIRGVRIEPEEIENRLLKHDSIKEAVVTVREVDPGHSPVKPGEKVLCAYVSGVGGEVNVTQLREYLSTHLPDYMIPVYIVQLDKIPLTPNGKKDRKALPEPGIDQGNEYIAPRNDKEKKLAEVWSDVLGTEKIGIKDNFFRLGGDSIKTIRIQARMNKYGYQLSARDILLNPTISELAPKIKKQEKEIDQRAVSGEFPLTPIQRELFEQGQDIHHYNQAVMLYSRERLEQGLIRKIFQRIQTHHDALRMTYKNIESGMVQVNHDLDYPLSFEVYDLSGTADSQKALFKKTNQIQSSINLEKGPMTKLGLFHLEDGDRLLIVIHHLVIDGISWRILFEDFEILYQRYVKGVKDSLPLKSHSYKYWAEKLVEYANSKKFLKEKTYWASLESTRFQPIKADFEGENDVEDEHILYSRLNAEETNLLLTKVNEPFNTDINDILLSALGLGIKEVFGIDKLLIALEGHGREEIIKDININRTIGWFTTVFPVVLDLSYEEDLSRQIIEIKETLHKIPNNGIGYGILKYLTAKDNKEGLEFKLKPQVSFNYMGQIDTDIKQMSLSIAKESPGNTRSKKLHRKYHFDVGGMISGKCLTMTITFSKKQFKPETLRTLLDHVESKLRHMIDFCINKKEKELTPSDLDYKDLSIDELETIFN